MGNLFSYNGPLHKFLSFICDLMILNLLWIISCIPIITIGCATVSLDYCCLRMQRDEGSIFKDYWQAFKSNLKQMIPMWLLIVLIGTVLAAEGALCYIYTFPGRDAVRILFYLGVLGFIGVLSYLFPLQAQFSNTIGKTFFNAVALAVVNWKTTLKLILLHLSPVIWFMLNAASFEKWMILWAILGVSVIEYLCTKLINPFFKPYLEPKTPEDTVTG